MTLITLVIGFGITYLIAPGLDIALGLQVPPLPEVPKIEVEAPEITRSQAQRIASLLIGTAFLIIKSMIP
jgi:hypothetical protein